MRAGNLAFRINRYHRNKNGPETVRTGQLVKVVVHEVSDQGLHFFGLFDVLGLPWGWIAFELAHSHCPPIGTSAFYHWLPLEKQPIKARQGEEWCRALIGLPFFAMHISAAPCAEFFHLQLVLVLNKVLSIV